MRTDRSVLASALGALLLLAVSACGPVLPTRLYTLVPADGEARAAADAEATGPASGLPALGLGRVTLPASLDRPEIVTRAGAHQIRLGELDKWVEPLQPMFQRLLERRLREATGAREVVSLPPRPGAPEPRHAVDVDVERFDADETGKVFLDARWRVYQVATDRTVKTGRDLIEQQGAPPPDYPALVAAMGRAVGALAALVAPAVPGSRAASVAAR